jgi:outer membrane protein assembly factor BamB
VDDEEEPFPDIRRPVRRPRDADDGASVKEFSYTSPVIVRRGLVMAGGWMQRGYVSSLVRALDIRTGALVWETLLSSSQLELTMFGEMAREPFGGMIEEHEGVIYYSTQMGVIAALEIDSGRIRWLTTYDVIEVQASLHRQALKRRIVWGPNPLLVVGNTLIATPRDSEYLYAIDTGRGPGGPLDAGRILWQAHNPDRHAQLGADLRDFLGYARGQLYFSSPTGITALDLTMLDPGGSLPAGRLEPRRSRWPSPSAGSQLIAGNGALTSAGIVYCDGESLGLVSLDLKQQSELVPRPLRRSDLGAQADLGTYPGRIHVSPGLILMTSRQFISAFTPEPAPAR